jgi:hypothetical protein
MPFAAILGSPCSSRAAAVLLIGALALGTGGCTLARNAITPTGPGTMDGRIDEDAGPDEDAAPDDAPLHPDTFVPPDGFVPPDAYVPPDAGCTIMPHCEGNDLVSCDGRTDCAASGRGCEGAACVMLCATGTTRCMGSVEERCDGAGHWGSASGCPLGCDGAMCAAVPTCTMFVAAGSITVSLGTSTLDLDLCTGSDMSVGDGGDTCNDADGRELMLTLDVLTTQTVTLDVRDRDLDTAVDTILYVRTSCAMTGSEIACDDDELCDTPGDGVDDPCVSRSGTLYQYGHSRITHTFAPGRYFVFVDSIAAGAASRCGTVELTATSS